MMDDQVDLTPDEFKQIMDGIKRLEQKRDLEKALIEALEIIVALDDDHGFEMKAQARDALKKYRDED